jgi:hypothetical protein
MSESISSRSSESQSSDHAQPTPEVAEQQAQSLALSHPYANLLTLQQFVGNQAVNELLQQKAPEADRSAELLQRASTESGQPLEESLRNSIEQHLGVPLDNVRIHTGAASEAAAASIDARAYTIGSDIHLGAEARQLSDSERQQLLAHEVVHTLQQGRSVPLEGTMPVSQPSDRAEQEAAQIASAIAETGESMNSPAIGLRDAMRSTSLMSVAPSIQRDIKGSKKLGYGKFEVNFKKIEGKAAGDRAVEKGSVTFTPSKSAPESDSIKFVQIVRTTDTSSGTEKDFVWTGGEAPRMKMMTSRDNAKNIAPGFFVDQIAASLAKRTSKADAPVEPYYDVSGPALAGNKVGKRKGKTIAPAVLVDTPGDSAPGKFIFVTSAKASDTGTWYGTVLWGFEIFQDKKGVSKIKGEYSRFREWRGETTDEALRLFNEFYRNPGATTAPKK